jgi:hypothetical protein
VACAYRTGLVFINSVPGPAMNVASSSSNSSPRSPLTMVMPNENSRVSLAWKCARVAGLVRSSWSGSVRSVRMNEPSG